MINTEIEKLSQFLQDKHKIYRSAQTNMGFILTDKCPVGCRHCISGNSLKNKNEPDISVLKSRVEKIKDLGLFEKIVITGGEPFHRYQILQSLIRFIKSLQLKVSVVTSAYWAENKTITREKLAELKNTGLLSLAISMDIYHQEKIPYNNVYHVLEACHELDIVNSVVFTWSGNRKKDQELLDTFKSSLPEYLQKKLRVTEGSMLNSGRALKNRLRFINGSENQIDPVICQSMGKIIRSDGQVALCCGADLPDGSPLLAGHIDTDTTESLLKSMNRNYLIPFIEIFGLRWMAERLKEAYPDFEFRKDEINTPNRCNICRKMFAEKRNSEFFASLFRNKNILDQIRGKYLLYYGHQFHETCK